MIISSLFKIAFFEPSKQICRRCLIAKSQHGMSKSELHTEENLNFY